jgi:hypothetical protein
MNGKSIDYQKVSNLMAEYFFATQEAHCLLCDNPMRNITIRRGSPQGCDGNCTHNKAYTKEDLLNMFIRETDLTEVTE